MHDAIVNDMYWNAGTLFGQQAIPVAGAIGKGLFGGTYQDYNKPIKDDDGNITGYEEGEIKGLFPWLKEGNERWQANQDKKNSLLDIIDDGRASMQGAYSSLDNALGGALPNFINIRQKNLDQVNNKIGTLDTQIDSYDESDVSQQNELQKLVNQKEALQRKANRITNSIEHAGKQFPLGYGKGKWAPGKYAGIAATSPVWAPYLLGKNIYGNTRELIKDARQRAALKKEEKRVNKKSKGQKHAEDILKNEMDLKKMGLFGKIFGKKNKESIDPSIAPDEYIQNPQSISLKDYLAQQEAAQSLKNAVIGAPKTLDYIPPKEINLPSSSMIDIAPIESPYADLDSIIKESPYYDSSLAVDTGALDNVDTSNVKPLPSLLDRVGVSEEIQERYPVSEETDPNVKLSYPNTDIGGPLGGALGGALSPSPEEPDTLGNRNNNPGNIKFAGQEGAVKQGDFAKFDTMEDGWKALYRQVELDTGRGDTIETFIKGTDGTGGYSEDNQEAYIRFISDKVGYPPDTPLSSIDPQDLVSAIAMMEGTIDSTDFAPSLEELTKSPSSNRNVLDAILQRGFMPVDTDSIRQQSLQQEDYRRKIRGY